MDEGVRLRQTHRLRIRLKWSRQRMKTKQDIAETRRVSVERTEVLNMQGKQSHGEARLGQRCEPAEECL